MCERHYRRWKKSGPTDNPRIDNLNQYEVAPSGCWLWTGALWPNGYGKPSIELHGTRLAHRAFYLEHVGPIPEGFDVDHRCHNADPDCERGEQCQHRRCVNPAHLEPVPRGDNLVRAIESRRMCENGLHDLTRPGAIRPGTKAQCVACWRTRYREAGARYRARKVKD